MLKPWLVPTCPALPAQLERNPTLRGRAQEDGALSLLSSHPWHTVSHQKGRASNVSDSLNSTLQTLTFCARVAVIPWVPFAHLAPIHEVEALRTAAGWEQWGPQCPRPAWLQAEVPGPESQAVEMRLPSLPRAQKRGSKLLPKGRVHP